MRANRRVVLNTLQLWMHIFARACMHRRNAGEQNDELRARLQHAFISPDFSACPPARRRRGGYL